MTLATSDALAVLPEQFREVAGHVLIVLAGSMRGPDAGWTNADIAARLGIRPLSHERRELDDTLREMKRRGLMRYDFQARGIPMEWMLTEKGIEIGRGLHGW